MNTKAAELKQEGGLKSLLYRPPWVGLLAFVIVFLFQGLGHTIMIVMEEHKTMIGKDISGALL